MPLPSRLRLSRLIPVAVAVAAALAFAPASAQAADTWQALVHECASTGQIANPGAYSPAVYKQALEKLPADISEYTNCYDIIHRAQLARAAGSSGTGNGSGGFGPITGGGGPGGTPQTAAEVNAVRHAQQTPFPFGPAPTSRLAPLLAVNPASLSHAIPAPIIVVLALLGAATLVLVARSTVPRVKRRLRG
ncbi:MAG: hypothetical protein ACR2HD_06940 [Solirubrobacteraceae bacterium]|nr:MAG: hypothetical protein DLM63_08420 [Solirubrobacterales bacterium]